MTTYALLFEAKSIQEYLFQSGRLRHVAIGSLPVNLAAEVCRRGGRYLYLSLDLTPGLRGVELSAGQKRACGARVEEYGVVRGGE